MVVDAADRQTGFFSDLAHRCAVEAVHGELVERGFDQQVACLLAFADFGFCHAIVSDR
jgi:hypothetical protein